VRENAKVFLLAGLFVALGLALVISPFASSSPDGLNRVAIDKGFDKSATSHALDDSPLAGYAVKGVDNAKLSKGLSGLIGVLITFGVGSVIFGVLRASRGRQRARTEVGEP
jgi:hypothetical protein